MSEVRPDQYFVWSPPSSTISVLLSLELVEALRTWVDQGAAASTEVAGLLLGRRDRDVSTRTVITVEDCEVLPRSGVDFKYVPDQHITSSVVGLIAGWEKDENEGREPVGLMRSDLSENCAPTEADLAFIHETLRDPESVFLLIQPGKDAIGILFHTGEADSSNVHVAPFHFDRELLAGDKRNLIQLPAGARNIKAPAGGGLKIGKKGRRATTATLLVLCAAGLWVWALFSYDQSPQTRTAATQPAVPVQTASNSKPSPLVTTIQPPLIPEQTVRVPAQASSRSERRRVVLPNLQPPPVPVTQAEATAPVAVAGPGPTPPLPSPEPRAVEPTRPTKQTSAIEVSSMYAPAPESGVRRTIHKIPGLRLLQHWRYKGGDNFVAAYPVHEAKPLIPRHADLPTSADIQLEVFLDDRGRVSGVDLLTPNSNHSLVGAAANAIYDSQFEPAKLNGKPVDSRLRATFQFRNTAGS